MHLPIDESGRSFFEYDKLTSNRYTFFSSLLVKISPRMYDTSVPKWPLEVSSVYSCFWGHLHCDQGWSRA